VIKEGGYGTASGIKEEIKDRLKKQCPDEEDDILNCRVNEAFEKAKAYDKQESAKQKPE
jgi:hypothetical protein